MEISYKQAYGHVISYLPNLSQIVSQVLMSVDKLKLVNPNRS